MQKKKNPLLELPDDRQLLKTISFWHDLSPEALEVLVCHCVIRKHPSSQVILLENDWGGSVYFILDGWVKIRTYNPEGKEITLNIIGKGELFGEMAALDEKPRSTDAITLTETTIASLPAHDFIELVEQEAKIAVRLSQIMAKRLRQVNRRLQLREADSMARVADSILFLAEGQGIETKGVIQIPNLPHREISSLCGLARETVTRVLTKLEKNGFIQREKDFISIPSLSNLKNIIQ